MGRSVDDLLTEHGIGVEGEHLEHYGIPGMRWGKRKRAKAEAKAAEAAKPKVSDMSDDELKSKINRIKLEKEYAKLTAPEVSAGRKIVGELLMEVGKQKAKSYLANSATDDLKKLLAKQAVNAVTPPAQRQVVQFAKRY